MNTDITTFLTSHYTPVQSSHLLSIYSALLDIYVEYDDSIINDYIYLLDTAEFPKDTIIDSVNEILVTDALGMLNIHGIITVDNVATSTVDALLQLVAYTNRQTDAEDLLDLLNTEDLPYAIAELAHSIATPPPFVDGFSVGHILEGILRVEPFLKPLLIRTITKDTADPPLTAAQAKYCSLFPDSYIAEMLQPVRLITTGGEVDTYQRIFLGLLMDNDATQVYIVALGIVVVSNTPADKYSEVFTELLHTYLEPSAIATISMVSSTHLKELSNVAT